ncbi:uncharacterized protein LOC100898457 [Galendromus occidentalis]|uniref:Uncharacterized protein LOC100898457 n=1 Tax=Galendromus occidentalis TaxID=34638 RepID=A0AAJ6QQK6_9ACAR|nr:uncharacterized protein LOC100898457 [Galendromus occidentalis]
MNAALLALKPRHTAQLERAQTSVGLQVAITSVFNSCLLYSDGAMAESKGIPPKKAGRARILQTKQHDTCLRLIQAVKIRPVLYNSKRIEYRNMDLKHTAWSEVQDVVKMASIASCQKLWKTLRDRFIRELRAVENSERAGKKSKDEPASSWPYYERLSFYKDCGRAPRTYTRSRKPRNSVTSVSSNDDSRDNSRNAAALASNSNSPVLVNAPSPTDLPSTSRDSNSNPAPPAVAELSVAADAQICTVSPAVQGPASSTPLAEVKPLVSVSPDLIDMSPEATAAHRAFIEDVMHRASNRDSGVAPRLNQTVDLPIATPARRIPLRECPPNIPFQAKIEQEPVWRLSDTGTCGIVQYGNDENHHNNNQVLGVNEQALDLSRDVSGSQPFSAIVQSPVPRYLPAAVYEHDQGTSVREGKPLDAVIQECSTRKRKSVMNGSAAKNARTDDEDELFALSLVPALKRLSEQEKSILKVRIMQNLAEAACGKLTQI